LRLADAELRSALAQKIGIVPLLGKLTLFKADWMARSQSALAVCCRCGRARLPGVACESGARIKRGKRTLEDEAQGASPEVAQFPFTMASRSTPEKNVPSTMARWRRVIRQ